MGFLAGKKLLITGVLSNRSIAYGIAKACHEQGAELAFSYVGERFKDRITEFAADFGSKLVFDCDVGDDAQIDKLFADLSQAWPKFDGFVHSIGFAPREAIAGDFLEGLSREAFRVAHDVSSYSFAALAKAALPMVRGRKASLVTLTYLGDGYWEVAHLGADELEEGEGRDIIRNVEQLQFADECYVLNPNLAPQVIAEHGFERCTGVGSVVLSTDSPVEDQELTATVTIEGVVNPTDLIWEWQFGEDGEEFEPSPNPSINEGFTSRFTPRDAEPGVLVAALVRRHTLAAVPALTRGRLSPHPIPRGRRRAPSASVPSGGRPHPRRRQSAHRIPTSSTPPRRGRRPHAPERMPHRRPEHAP